MAGVEPVRISRVPPARLSEGGDVHAVHSTGGSRSERNGLTHRGRPLLRVIALYVDAGRLRPRWTPTADPAAMTITAAAPAAPRPASPQSKPSAEPAT